MTTPDIWRISPGSDLTYDDLDPATAMSGSVLHRFIADLTAAHVIRTLGHLPVAGYLARHPEALRAGSYEGSDLQNMPLAICRDCGHAAGLEYLGGTVPRCACGGAWRPYVFQVDGEVWDHVRVAKRFYGLTHVVFANDAAHGRSNRTWEQMQWIVANVLRDAERGSYAGPCTAPRPEHVGGAVAFAAGWLSHIVSDSWMKDAVPNACAVQLPDGTKKSVGVILPSTLTFNTGVPEIMECVSGVCRYRIKGDDWKTSGAGQSFKVPGNSSFEIEVNGEPYHYVCHFA